MRTRISTARVSPLAFVAFTWLAACGDSNGEGPGVDAGGSSGGGQGGASGSPQAGGAGGKAGSGGAGAGGTAGSGGSAGVAGSGSELCADYSGGAFVAFDIVGESLRVWIENEDFIAECQRLLSADETRVPNFITLLDGVGCDAQYSWHPDPNDVEFADFTTEVCDGLPSYVEETKEAWLGMSYCPWLAVVTAVDER